jgi:hypothetical protein
VTDNPARCKIHVIICFVHAKNMSAAEIHSELCVVYSQYVKSEGTEFSKLGEHMLTMKRDVIDQPSVVIDDLIQSVD